MTQVITIFDNALAPEHMLPSLHAPVGGPINGERAKDYRCDFEQLQADMRTAWDFAAAQHLPVLTAACDRNGAYLVVAPSKHIYKLFGDEAACWQRVPGKNGVVVEHWMGAIGHIRVFWRDVKCTH